MSGRRGLPLRRRPSIAATAVGALCVFAAFPIYWMLKVSFQTSQELLQPRLLPRSATLANYEELWKSTDFSSYLMNSAIAAVGTTVLTVVASSMAGYGLARFPMRGKKPVARGVLFVYMIPGLALAIPLYSIFNQLGLTNSLAGLIVAHSSLTLPFGIWLTWQFFQTVPKSYQESAYSLGASKARTFVEVELPIASPGIIAVAIFAFALSWEDFTLAFILTTDVASKTLPVGMAGFVERGVVHWGLIMGSAVIMAVPALLIVMFLQRYLVKGLGAGGIKG